MTEALFTTLSVPEYRLITLMKVAVAGAAVLVLAWEILARSSGNDRHRRVRASAIAALGLIGALSWWNFGKFHYPDYIQVHEHYHYYLGSKYFSELGYTRLYRCAAEAAIEQGHGQDVAKHWIRDLSTNQLESGENFIRGPRICRTYFSAERWEQFNRDVAWFIGAKTPGGWWVYQTDHGYNATPVWGMVGGWLANATQANGHDLHLLALIDPVLLLVMFATIWWAFGWQALCVALIWFGTNYPARYLWTGGAFLRADWLALSVIGICLVKRQKMALGGFALTYAALLRIFPALIIGGLLLKVAATMWRARTFALPVGYRSFAAGCLVAVVLLVPLSMRAVGGSFAAGVDAWSGFIDNSRKHLETPLANNMGLMSVLSYKPSARMSSLGNYWLDTPWDTWTIANQQAVDSRKPLLWILLLPTLGLFATVARREEDWVALILGVALIPLATQLTCYYYAIFLAFSLLWQRAPWSGVALAGLSAASLVVPTVWSVTDDTYLVISLLTVIFACGTAVHLLRRGPDAAALRPVEAFGFGHPLEQGTGAIMAVRPKTEHL